MLRSLCPLGAPLPPLGPLRPAEDPCEFKDGQPLRGAPRYACLPPGHPREGGRGDPQAPAVGEAGYTRCGSCADQCRSDMLHLGLHRVEADAESPASRVDLRERLLDARHVFRGAIPRFVEASEVGDLLGIDREQLRRVTR